MNSKSTVYTRKSMPNKLKVSHFTSKGVSISKNAARHTLDQPRLARLYPDPKTYEQRQQDDDVRQQAYRRRLPKYPSLAIAMYGSIFLGLCVWFAQNLSSWWLGNGDSGTTMAAVFFTFAMGLALAFMGIIWVNYVNKVLSYFDGAVRIFWLVQSISIAGLLSLWLSGWAGIHHTSLLWIPALMLIHFTVVFFSARYIAGRVV